MKKVALLFLFTFLVSAAHAITCDNVVNGHLTIPDSQTTISAFNFYGCTALTEVTIGTGVTEIQASAFENTGLTTVNIPDNVQIIGEDAFWGSPITDITFGTGITHIALRAFSKEDISKLNIKKASLIWTTIVEDAMNPVSYGCDRCYYHPFFDIFQIWESRFGKFQNDDIEIIIEDSSYTASSILQHIDYEPLLQDMLSCDDVSDGKLTIPNNFAIIPEDAFRECTNLNEVTIGTGVKVIRTNAFRNTGLTTVNIPDNVEEIGENAFSDSPITELTIGTGIKVIDLHAFGNDNGVTKLNIKRESTLWTTKVEDADYSVTTGNGCDQCYYHKFFDLFDNYPSNFVLNIISPVVVPDIEDLEDEILALQVENDQLKLDCVNKTKPDDLRIAYKAHGQC